MQRKSPRSRVCRATPSVCAFTESSRCCASYSTRGSTMSDEKSATDAKAAWLAQPLEGPTMVYVRLRASEHGQYGHNRSMLEYGAAAGGLAVAVWLVIANDSLLLRA